MSSALLSTPARLKQGLLLLLAPDRLTEQADLVDALCPGPQDCPSWRLAARKVRVCLLELAAIGLVQYLPPQVNAKIPRRGGWRLK